MADITAIVLTKNEEKNLPDCLSSLRGFAARVVVVDSGSTDRTVEIARAYGIERVMFGSDFPMWSPVNEYNMLAAMPFTEDEFEAITWHNAQRFIGQKIK